MMAIDIANEDTEQVEHKEEESENEYTVVGQAKDKHTQKIIEPSYTTKLNIKSVLLLSEKQSIIDINNQYIRTRRFDNAGKYRIGPTFINKNKLAYMDENKPGRISVSTDELSYGNLEFGLLTYLWTFTDQHDKQEIDLGFLKSLVDSGVNINVRDEYGQTILHAIVRDWHPDVALFAIRNNADVNAQDRYGRSPLHLAAALNSVEMLKVLLKNGADVHMETFKELQTPVHCAAKYNSLDALKILIKHQGSITKRDYKDCTVLYLAAEKGSTETAQFLLDIGAPAGVYNCHGNSVLTRMLEKIPNVAYRALEQFQAKNVSLKRCYMYLRHLESDTTTNSGDVTGFARTPLEIITAYGDVDLIMHPVIQKCIEIKWNLFGRKDTIEKLVITLVYLACWLVLAYTYTDDGDYYYTSNESKVYSTHIWKIIPEALIIIFALYFVVKEFVIKNKAIKRHRRFVEWKLHLVHSQFIFCHPAWPGERESLENEADRIRRVPTLAGQQTFWFIYEILILFLLATSIVLRIVTMSVEKNIKLFLAAKVFFAVNMVFSFLRLLKICLRFGCVSIFLKVTGLAVTSFIQAGFLYIQFYIPFVALFWLLFGGEEGETVLTARLKTLNLTLDFDGRPDNEAEEIKVATSVQTFFYFMFEALFGQEHIYKYRVMDKHAVHVIISLYHIVSTFITLSIFVAFVTSKFTMNYKRFVGEASLLQASIVLEVEKRLNKREQLNVRKYYAKYCSPLVVHLDSTPDDIRKRDALTKIAQLERYTASTQNIMRDAEERHRKNDRRQHSAIFDSIVGSSSLMRSKQEAFNRAIKGELKDIVQKQTYMNKYLLKLL